MVKYPRPRQARRDLSLDRPVSSDRLTVIEMILRSFPYAVIRQFCRSQKLLSHALGDACRLFTAADTPGR